MTLGYFLTSISFLRKSISLSMKIWNFNKSSKIVNILAAVLIFFSVCNSNSSKHSFKQKSNLGNPLSFNRILFMIKLSPLTIAPKALIVLNLINQLLLSKQSKIWVKFTLVRKFYTKWLLEAQSTKIMQQ